MQHKTDTNHAVINKLYTAIINNDLTLIKQMMNKKDIEVVDLFYTMMDPCNTSQQITPYQLARQKNNQLILTYFKEECSRWVALECPPLMTKLLHAIIKADLKALKNLLPLKTWRKELNREIQPSIVECMTKENTAYISAKTGRHFYLTPYNFAYVIGEQSILDYFYNDLISRSPHYFNCFLMAIVCHQPLETLKKTKESFFKAIPHNRLSDIANPLFKALKTHNLLAFTYLRQDPKVKLCSQKQEVHSLENYARLFGPEESLNILNTYEKNKNKPPVIMVSKNTQSFFSIVFTYNVTYNEIYTTDETTIPLNK